MFYLFDAIFFFFYKKKKKSSRHITAPFQLAALASPFDLALITHSLLIQRRQTNSFALGFTRARRVFMVVCYYCFRAVTVARAVYGGTTAVAAVVVGTERKYGTAANYTQAALW
jgi:hypothetical protein